MPVAMAGNYCNQYLSVHQSSQIGGRSEECAVVVLWLNFFDVMLMK